MVAPTEEGVVREMARCLIGDQRRASAAVAHSEGTRGRLEGFCATRLEQHPQRLADLVVLVDPVPERERGVCTS